MSCSHQQGRAAFLFNANAKSVTGRLKKRLSRLIPKEDLYFSNSLIEAEKNVRKILDKGYAYIFSGGGDGTAVSTINFLNEYAGTLPEHQIPRIGLLRLGTGNALARMLGAKKPEEDIKAILGGQCLKPLLVSMVETKSGQLTPFAGIGYDGELMNDFESVKDVFFDSPFRKFFSSFLGFSIAGIFKTLPRQATKSLPTVRVSSSYPVYRISSVNKRDEESYIEKGSVIYEGVAPLICVGTIPSLGYGIKMFPFANKRPGYMHLRISAVPLLVLLSKIYPSIWQGRFRHPKLFDYLVRDVTIESEESLPYQFAGA